MHRQPGRVSRASAEYIVRYEETPKGHDIPMTLATPTNAGKRQCKAGRHPEGHNGLLDSWEDQKSSLDLPDDPGNTHERRQAPAQGGGAARDCGCTGNQVEALASKQSTS